MTRQLEKAFQAASRLPSQEQDALAQWLMDELKSERRWAELLADSPELLDDLAEKALSEHRAGRSEPLDPERL